MTTSFCEVCASEPFKYRCPTCGLTSCSLACTQSHKIYCAPKAQATAQVNGVSGTQLSANETNGNEAREETQRAHNGPSLPALASSPQIRDLLDRCPSLRIQLRDIYQATLQEEWVEGVVSGDKARSFGRGKFGHRNRGPWTREKGFKRGLGKVRKYRERCEDELETGKNAEAFMQLLTLVNRVHPPEQP